MFAEAFCVSKTFCGSTKIFLCEKNGENSGAYIDSAIRKVNFSEDLIFVVPIYIYIYLQPEQQCWEIRVKMQQCLPELHLYMDG